MHRHHQLLPDLLEDQPLCLLELESNTLLGISLNGSLDGAAHPLRLSQHAHAADYDSLEKVHVRYDILTVDLQLLQLRDQTSVLLLACHQHASEKVVDTVDAFFAEVLLHELKVSISCVLSRGALAGWLLIAPFEVVQVVQRIDGVVLAVVVGDFFLGFAHVRLSSAFVVLRQLGLGD